MTQDILVVDDEGDIRLLLKGILNDEGWSVREAANSDETMQAILARKPSLVILDIWLQGSKKDGMEILKDIRAEHPDMPVIMISGHGNIETAVAATKSGAFDFIEKPFKTDRLVLQVQHALESARLKRENSALRSLAGADSDLIGRSSAVNQIRQIVDRVAPTGSRVMIVGPSGAGKETVARMLHARSRRADAAFVVINCAATQPEHLELELFGTEQPIGGGSRKIGVLEQSHGGTLYLDEVSDMPVETQGKLVRVLQEQAFTRLGGNTRVEVDVRVIAASSGDVQMEVQLGKLRQDLYYRLNVVPIKIPGLTERREDIPTLAAYFLARAAEQGGAAARVLGEDAIAALQAYNWPGNVRQLRNAMEWVMIMASGDPSEPVRMDMLPPEVTSTTPAVLRWEHSGEIMGLPLRDAREMFEREYLIAQVTRFGGNISRTANFVGMERSALHRKLKLLGVHGNGSDGVPVAEGIN
ncbi:MAG: sigma-54-dependent Fis family transcriptional regulator [Alphaproteobacteria bacterium]|nr:sigma-54-dependent Fis family transcriptional regulator [Alphaproteobacteria bacterium]MBV8549273.1 sigma-54-dependent Fis family transcriptional regulator [Alphaproteobacteria bacterium]